MCCTDCLAARVPGGGSLREGALHRVSTVPSAGEERPARQLEVLSNMCILKLTHFADFPCVLMPEKGSGEAPTELPSGDEVLGGTE